VIKKAKAKPAKPKAKSKPTTDDKKPEVPRAVYTIPEFCEAHRLSVALYFKLKAAGNGPVEGHIGSRIVISLENAAKWLKEIEDAKKTAKVEKTETVAA
jgi:hypothetical protein